MAHKIIPQLISILLEQPSLGTAVECCNIETWDFLFCERVLGQDTGFSFDPGLRVLMHATPK